MLTRSIAELERIRYSEGQLLTSRDLQDNRDFEALLRWMHTRFLHNTWGIAFGLDVQLGDHSTLQISPGLAYDCHGREILLTRADAIDVPGMGVDEQFDLVIRYKTDAEFASRPAVVPVCLMEETDPRQGWPLYHITAEQPVFRWRRPAAVRIAEEIPLVRLQSDPGGNVTLNRRVRRNACPLKRPHIGYGFALVDITTTDPWTVTLPTGSVMIGRQIQIDTSAAAFMQTPHYIVMTELLIELPQTQLSLSVQGFESITDAQLEKFTYRLVVLQEPGIDETSDISTSVLAGQPLVRAGISRPIKIAIFWIGVEPG
jgi:hypothetical protein